MTREEGIDNEDAKLATLETRLFDSISRMESSLMQSGFDQTNFIVDRLFNIPSEDPMVAVNLLEMSSLLESEALTGETSSTNGIQNLSFTFQLALVDSWQRSITPQIDLKLKEFAAKQRTQMDLNAAKRLDLDIDDEWLKSLSVVGRTDSELDKELQDIILNQQIKPEKDHPSQSSMIIDTFQLDSASTIIDTKKENFSNFVPNKKPRNCSPMDIDNTASNSLMPPVIDKQRPFVDKPPARKLFLNNEPAPKHRIEIDLLADESNTEQKGEEVERDIQKRASDFITAKQFAVKQDAKKNGSSSTSSFNNSSYNNASNGNNTSYNGSSSVATGNNAARKTLGTGRRKFVPPMKSNKANDNMDSLTSEVSKRVFGSNRNDAGSNSKTEEGSAEPVDERLKNIDPKMIETIQNEIMSSGTRIEWDDIAGLHHAKKSIQEAVIWPMLRPDIFQGLRKAPRGILLFGPPGTGKTMIGKCIASTAGCTFFSISASSLTSKWVGEGEKMVRALFAVARVHQPSVIFIDEIDSLLTQRTDGEFEASRRIKTEFLIQFDGAHVSKDEDQILLIGATNRPQEIDEAARRRLIKRYYIPLPDPEARECIIKNLLTKQKHNLSEDEIVEIARQTKGYSGSDMDGLCREAALGPVRKIPMDQIQNISVDQVAGIAFDDFLDALSQVRASVSDKDLDLYREWNENYGSLPHLEIIKE